MPKVRFVLLVLLLTAFGALFGYAVYRDAQKHPEKYQNNGHHDSSDWYMSPANPVGPLGPQNPALRR